MNFDVVEVVIDKTIRAFNLREWQYDIEDVVEDIAEALKLIGAAKLYAEKVATLTVTGKIAPLPRDCENIKHLIPESTYYRESGSYIEVDAADGTQIQMAYQAMPTDTRGYPVVPDNAAVREALMWYLAKMLALQGELKTISWAQAEQEWQWRCGSARAELNVLNMQQTSRIYNDFVRLNPIKDQHMKNYTEVGKPNTLDRDKFKHNPNL
jgi:hypothetical protein